MKSRHYPVLSPRAPPPFISRSCAPRPPPPSPRDLPWRGVTQQAPTEVGDSAETKPTRALFAHSHSPGNSAERGDAAGPDNAAGAERCASRARDRDGAPRTRLRSRSAAAGRLARRRTRPPPQQGGLTRKGAGDSWRKAWART